mgnify:CR=1 FL=1
MGRITQPTKVKRGKMWKINKIKTFLKRPKAIVWNRKKIAMMES